MDNEYAKELDIIESTKNEIEKCYEDIPSEDLEDNEVSKSLEKLLEQLEATKSIINHFSKPTKEGHLILVYPNAKYQIKFLNGDISNEIECGNYLEICGDDKDWKAGRVEHTIDKGYYFYNSEVRYPVLSSDMKVRVRIM